MAEPWEDAPIVVPAPGSQPKPKAGAREAWEDAPIVTPAPPSPLGQFWGDLQKGNYPFLYNPDKKLFGNPQGDPEAAWRAAGSPIYKSSGAPIRGLDTEKFSEGMSEAPGVTLGGAAAALPTARAFHIAYPYLGAAGAGWLATKAAGMGAPPWLVETLKDIALGKAFQGVSKNEPKPPQPPPYKMPPMSGPGPAPPKPPTPPGPGAGVGATPGAPTPASPLVNAMSGNPQPTQPSPIPTPRRPAQPAPVTPPTQPQPAPSPGVPYQPGPGLPNAPITPTPRRPNPDREGVPYNPNIDPYTAPVRPINPSSPFSPTIPSPRRPAIDPVTGRPIQPPTNVPPPTGYPGVTWPGTATTPAQPLPTHPWPPPGREYGNPEATTPGTPEGISALLRAMSGEKPVPGTTPKATRSAEEQAIWETIRESLKRL